MHVLFNAAMRWELIPYQLNPMSLVRVKDGSKRMREPRVVSVDEFLRISEHIPEPFRTMCIVAMCMGLRVSEILGLKWCDVDWESMRIGIRESYVTESLALSKRRLLSDGCHLTLLWRTSCDSINCGVLRRRTNKTGSLQTRIQESRTGPVKSRRTGSSPQRRRWGWAGSAGIPSSTGIPL